MSTFSISFLGLAQEVRLPADFRSHNLIQFNSSLFDPTLSFERNMPRSFSIWSRWQWQSIDGDPTSLFANYTQKIGNQTAMGLGYLQNNTGVYLNKGGNFNFSHALPLGEESSLIFGANVFAFNQELADDQLILGNGTPVGMLNDQSNFIIQFSPGLRVNTNGFGIGVVIQNALDFNITSGEREAAPRILTGLASYDFPINLFGDEGYLRPQAYIHSIPDADTQYGITAAMSTSNFWIQGGYNNFYGASGGLGVTLFKKLSLGGVMEFGIEDPVSNEDPTFEIVASYFFGDQKFSEKDSKEKAEVEKRRRSDVDEREEQRRLAQARLDSTNNARKEALAAAREQARLDSIARVKREQEVVLQENEKYEEVVSSDGLQPGFYLIANVFGTEHYYLKFMKSLRAQGLEPKSFYRRVKGHHYVYLERYDTLEESRIARDSRFGGKYSGTLWVFRIRGR